MSILDPKTIKKDFPIFNKEAPFVYLDTAATSQTPQVVVDAMYDYYANFRANIHRGLYVSGERASEAYEEARKSIARFIGAETREIIFTAGATASSNMLVSMLEHSDLLKKGDEVVTTIMEHHASLIPLQQLAKRKGLVMKYIPLTQSGGLDYEEAKNLITSKTKIISVMLASNVTGAVNDVVRIVEMGHKVGSLVISDATAAVGHIPVDVTNLGVDFMYFSGHKMCGPTGVGVLWGRADILENLEPGMYGGGIVDEVTLDRAIWRKSPERFEAGTPNIAGVIGLASAVMYLENIGIENIHTHTQRLVDEATKRIEELPGIRIIAERGAVKNVGIVSFVDKDIHPHDIADIFGCEGVAVRAGHHCAMPLITALKVRATVRASFYLYSTSEDVDALVDGIKKAQEIFK